MVTFKSMRGRCRPEQATWSYNPSALRLLRNRYSTCNIWLVYRTVIATKCLDYKRVISYLTITELPQTPPVLAHRDRCNGPHHISTPWLDHYLTRIPSSCQSNAKSTYSDLVETDDSVPICIRQETTELSQKCFAYLH